MEPIKKGEMSGWEAISFCNSNELFSWSVYRRKRMHAC